MPQDTTNFHLIYSAHADAVYRFAYWLSGDSEDARDITSETFVRVWTGEAEIRFESVRGYLFAIARNLYFKQRAKSKRWGPIDDQTADEAPRPDQVAGARSDLEEALGLIRAMPEPDRTALMLRAEELPYEEIANLMGMTSSAVKVRVFRARARLQSKFAQSQKGKS